MNANILTIGDELLIGNTINTNAAWIAQQLNIIGVDVKHHITLSDLKEDIVHGLDLYLKDADIIVITGGLGPTNDDITKKVLCEYFHGNLVFNEEAYFNIERIFNSRKRLINEATKLVAYLPDNCQPIQNKNGTAAGMIFTKQNKTIVSMPGVPYEMKAMFKYDFIPYILKKYTLPIIIHKHILTVGIGESQIADELVEFEKKLPSTIKLAYLPSIGKVKLRLTAKGTEVKLLQNQINEATAYILNKVKNNVYGFDDDIFEAKIGELLKENKLTLCSAESCTGGNIAHLITSVSGSSTYFKGSVVAYDNSIKENILKVKKKTLQEFGAVSEQTVSEMLDGVLSIMDADVAVATSGIAGPSGGTNEKPVGTVVIGVASKNNQYIKKIIFTNNRAVNIELSSIVALFMLKKFVEKHF
jgi:nicotinamide-nucleotide amidase